MHIFVVVFTWLFVITYNPKPLHVGYYEDIISWTDVQIFKFRITLITFLKSALMTLEETTPKYTKTHIQKSPIVRLRKWKALSFSSTEHICKLNTNTILTLWAFIKAVRKLITSWRIYESPESREVNTFHINTINWSDKWNKSNEITWFHYECYVYWTVLGINI